MSRLIIFLLVVGMLAACGQPNATTLPAATAPVPTQPPPTAPAQTQPVPTGTPIRVDLTPAQRAAMQALVEAINVPVDQIQLISTEAVQWPDGCLGIVRINARCMGGPIDGFRIILEANGQQYEFHTNQDGTADRAIGKKRRSSVSSCARRTIPSRSSTRKCQSIRGPCKSRPACCRKRAWSAARSTPWTSRISRGRWSMDKNGTRPLDFIRNPDYGLAVWSERSTPAWAGLLRPLARARRLNCLSATSMVRS